MCPFMEHLQTPTETLPSPLTSGLAICLLSAGTSSIGCCLLLWSYTARLTNANLPDSHTPARPDLSRFARIPPSVTATFTRCSYRRGLASTTEAGGPPRVLPLPSPPPNPARSRSDFTNAAGERQSLHLITPMLSLRLHPRWRRFFFMLNPPS